MIALSSTLTSIIVDRGLCCQDPRARKALKSVRIWAETAVEAVPGRKTRSLTLFGMTDCKVAGMVQFVIPTSASDGRS
jgi:hypothetical protein